MSKYVDEIIRWHLINTCQLPDNGRLVLIQWEDNVGVGNYKNNSWEATISLPFSWKVIAWADFPKGIK